MSRIDDADAPSQSRSRTLGTATRARLLLTQTLRPTGAEIVDMTAVLGLGLVALWGFHASWSGWWFLAVGGLGLALGEFVAHIANRLNQPTPVLALLVVVAFFLLGGPFALSVGGGSALPLPSTVSDLTDGLVHGWKDLLTTLPPLDATGPLLVVPWVLGLAGGAVGLRATRVRRWPILAALPPLALLVAVVLLGVDRPVSWAQGVVFGAGLVAWLVHRSERSVSSSQGRGLIARSMMGALLVALAAVLAVPLGSAVAAGHHREVLRDQVEPPFDIGQYPSPLAGFRHYTKQAHPVPSNAYDKLLLSIKGVPDNSLIRFATLDRYDGTVWGASNGGSPGGVDSTYQRVGSTIADPVPGRHVHGEVTIGPGYNGVWLPVFGALRTLQFRGPSASSDKESFRYNLADSTGVVPTVLNPGDSYSFTAAVPDTKLTRSVSLANGSVEIAADTSFAAQATSWAGSGSAYDRIMEIATHLRDQGYYSDGDGADAALYHPGHFVARLDSFLTDPRIVGDDEQYAATMAILANRVGVPARVAFGAVEHGGSVYGRDMRAWVEVLGADGTWYTLDREAYEPAQTKRPPKSSPPEPQNIQKGIVVPPPAPAPPPSNLSDPTDTDLHAKPALGSLFGLPAWAWALIRWVLTPVVLLVLLCAGIIGAKILRRRRRRNHPRVLSRYIGGWYEVLDHAADLGLPTPRIGTRRAQAGGLGWAPAGAIAAVVDRQVFGPGEASADEAAAYWTDLERQLEGWTSGEGRWQRWRVALSLRSFLRRTPLADVRLPPAIHRRISWRRAQ